MSNIFEALNRSKDQLANVVRSTLPDQPAILPAPDLDEVQPPADLMPADAPLEPSKPPVRPDLLRSHFRIPSPSPLLPFEGKHWHASEQYRALRTKLLQHPRQPRMVVISSPGSGDGKSITSINLAAAMALKSEADVLLIDGDFRRSSIHALLGLPASPGLAEVLAGSCNLDQAMVHSEEFENLHVIPAGKPPCNPAELLDSAAWPSLCEQLRGSFRYIIVDSPPVGAVTDYDLIHAQCDGVILVLRPDHTNRDLCFDALASVPKDKLLGLVLNCVPDWALDKSNYRKNSYYLPRN